MANARRHTTFNNAILLADVTKPEMSNNLTLT